jgi:hypothetical protein
MTKRLDVGDKYANFIGRLTDAERKELGERLAAQAVVRMLKRARPYLAMAEKPEKAK